MNDRGAPQMPAESASFLSRLVKPIAVILVFAGLWFGAGAVGEFLQPWRFADADTCIAIDYDRGAYRNACDKDINIGWCADGPPADGTACVMETLVPKGESNSWIGTLPGSKGRPGWRHACDAPYLPAWVDDPVKATRKKSGCRRTPDREQKFS